jgi:Cu(I)/Ag(I) efflux system protein CusF
MLKTRIALATFIAALAFAGVANAQNAPSSMPDTAPAASTSLPADSTEMTEGEIRKVDKDNKKLTIRHGPLKSLDMPGMTMVFGVKDETVLDKVQTGEKVRFQAEKIDGKFIVTAIEAAR